MLFFLHESNIKIFSRTTNKQTNAISPNRQPRPPLTNKRMDAISPRRRRITEFGKPNSVSRSRTIFSCQGRHHIGEHMDLHKLYPSPPPYKSFAELFQKRPFPRSPRSPHPPLTSERYRRCHPGERFGLRWRDRSRQRDRSGTGRSCAARTPESARPAPRFPRGD